MNNFWFIKMCFRVVKRKTIKTKAKIRRYVNTIKNDSIFIKSARFKWRGYFFIVLTLQFTLSRESWKIPWCANSGTSGAWDLTTIKAQTKYFHGGMICRLMALNDRGAIQQTVTRYIITHRLSVKRNNGPPVAKQYN